MTTGYIVIVFFGLAFVVALISGLLSTRFARQYEQELVFSNLPNLGGYAVKMSKINHDSEVMITALTSTTFIPSGLFASIKCYNIFIGNYQDIEKSTITVPENEEREEQSDEEEASGTK
jgi:hypothetical protein